MGGGCPMLPPPFKNCPIEPLLGVMPEQGASRKIAKGALSRHMIILEQGAPNMIKRSMEQRKI